MDKIIYSIVYLKTNPGKLNELLAGLKGIAGAALYAVSFDEITAVVSDINRADFSTDRTNAIQYAAVIESLAEPFTVLPMRYGSLVESAGLISKMLERNYHAFRENLQKVENKYEFGLKIFCDPEKLKAALKAQSETGTQPSAESLQGIENSVFREYVTIKLKAHRLEELLLYYVDSVIAQVVEYLTPLDAVSKFKKLVSEKNIIDAIFLLAKDKKDKLIQSVEYLQNQYPDLNFVLTGPWPPYNFVDIAIK